MVIKKSLGFVNNSAIDLAFYSNMFSGCLMVPLALLFGEGPDLWMLATGQEPLGRLLWGTLATVRRCCDRHAEKTTLTMMLTRTGCFRLLDWFGWSPQRQSYLSSFPHGLFCRAWCSTNPCQRLVPRRQVDSVGFASLPIMTDTYPLSYPWLTRFPLAPS